MGKIWRGKILANSIQFAKIFHANGYKYSETTGDLPADSPKFSSPFVSSAMICQNFLPPKFSHVRYSNEKDKYVHVKSVSMAHAMQSTVNVNVFPGDQLTETL